MSTTPWVGLVNKVRNAIMGIPGYEFKHAFGVASLIKSNEENFLSIDNDLIIDYYNDWLGIQTNATAPKVPKRILTEEQKATRLKNAFERREATRLSKIANIEKTTRHKLKMIECLTATAESPEEARDMVEKYDEWLLMHPFKQKINRTFTIKKYEPSSWIHGVKIIRNSIKNIPGYKNPHALAFASTLKGSNPDGWSNMGRNQIVEMYEKWLSDGALVIKETNNKSNTVHNVPKPELTEEEKVIRRQLAAQKRKNTLTAKKTLLSEASSRKNRRTRRTRKYRR
jgi:hypothetical protein